MQTAETAAFHVVRPLAPWLRRPGLDAPGHLLDLRPRHSEPRAGLGQLLPGRFAP